VHVSEPRRIEIDAESVDRGLGRLVLVVLDLVRQLLERQALRRAETLPPDVVERLGRALLMLDERFIELRDRLGLTNSDLALPLEIADLAEPSDTGGFDDDSHDHRVS
jgi:CRP-like cAMP-binding protein